MRKMDIHRWKKMNRNQRWQYFCDYYLLRTLGVIAAAALAVSLLWHFLKPAQEWALYVGFVDEKLNRKEADDISRQLEALYESHGNENPVMLDDDFYLEQNGLSKMQVYLSNHQLDVVVAQRETFKVLAGYGFFQDLEEAVPGIEREALIHVPGYKDSKEITMEDRETGRGKVKAYGIVLSGSKAYAIAGNVIKDPVAGIVLEAPNQREAIEFIQYIRRK